MPYSSHLSSKRAENLERWLLSSNAKDIGILYIIFALFALLNQNNNLSSNILNNWFTKLFALFAKNK